MNLLATEILTPRYALAWYPWAVQYFFLIAISYSALMLSLPGLVFRRERFMPLARLALLVAVSCTLVGPVALLADLHQPARFWHSYASPAPWSWMSIGAVLLPPYVVLTILYGYFAWRPALMARGAEGQGWDARLARLLCLGNWQAPRLTVVVFGLLAALFACGIMLYTGGEIAILASRPLWNTHWLPVMFVLTGLIAASGLVMLLNRLMVGANADVYRQGLKVILVAILGAALVAAIWFIQGITGYSPSVQAALESVRHNPDWTTIAIWALSAGILLFLVTVAMLRTPKWQRWAWLLGLLAIHMGWAFRWLVLMEVQTVAKNTAGYYHLAVAAGSYGLLGIIGTFGLWLAVLLIIDILVPWRDMNNARAATH